MLFECPLDRELCDSQCCALGGCVNDVERRQALPRARCEGCGEVVALHEIAGRRCFDCVAESYRQAQEVTT